METTPVQHQKATTVASVPHQLQQLQILHRAALAINASLDLDEILHAVLEEVSQALEATGWAAWLLDDGESQMICHQASGPGNGSLLGYHLPVDSSLVTPLLETGRSYYISDTSRDHDFDSQIAHQRGTAMRSLICAPLLNPDPASPSRIMGLIAVVSEAANAFTEDDLALVDALAASASAAIHNGELYQRAKQEIAERHRVEAALRESESHYRTLVETSPDAVVLIDLDGRIQLCNRRALDLFGYDHQLHLLGRNYLSLFPAEHRTDAIKGFGSVLQGATLRSAEIPLLRSDGHIFEGEIAAALAADNRGEPASIVGFARDVTDRKAAEAAMRRHNQELRVLNDIATQISQTQSIEHLLQIAVEKTLAAMSIDTGWAVYLDDIAGAPGKPQPSILIFRGLLEVPRIKARTASLRRQLAERVKESRQPIVLSAAELFELYVSTPASCQVIGIPLIATNEVLGLIGVVGIHDRHPRTIQTRQIQLLSTIGHQVSVALENARLASEAAEVHMLRELERMRSELIANFSHDLRTPLGLIEMAASTLLRDDIELDPKLNKDFLRDIMAQTDHLSHLVEGILDLGRLENGHLKLDLVRFDLGELASQVTHEFKERYSHHSFVVEFPERTLWIIADPDRIEQVLYNLLDNAVKYSPNQGEIHIEGERDEEEITIRITDSGIGIPAEQSHLVFERFFRGENATTEGINGVGLGLPTCKGIIEAHGGDIRVKSTLGVGSTFAFTLPAAPDATSQYTDTGQGHNATKVRYHRTPL